MLKNIASYTELPDSSEKTIDIGFDCDDVLFSCSDYAIEKVNEDYNLDLDPNKVTRWGYKIGDYKKMYQYFSDENEYERARAIALRKHLSGKDDFPRIMRALSSKGFPSSIAYRVARDLADED